ncbi:MAG: dienelactone hydrolase family protein [Rhodobacteraceae bacterium]|jgi:phospholipase/carboxylesterase|nr:dienelactone hydrolase family protein [Paracoccaceae bacterium]
MTRDLGFGRRGPAPGRARSLVVFLHGYGADGADLLGLAEPLAPHLPGTAFIAPDAPERSGVNPFGYQWFPIPWLDGSPAAAAEVGLLAAAADLDAFLDARLTDEGLVPAAMAVVGFSQGTMMALHVAPRRPKAVAAVVGFSGRLLGPDALARAARSRPPVLLVHGDADPVVPPESLPEAAAALAEAGFEVATHVSRGVGHGIAPDGLSAAVTFLRARLPR